MSTDQELLVIETWGRLVHSKVLKDGGAMADNDSRAEQGSDKRPGLTSNDILEPEPEPEPNPVVEEETLRYQKEHAVDALTQAVVAPETQPSTPQQLVNGASLASTVDYDDVVTATATATSPITTHGTATSDITGTPSPSRDDSAAARAALVVGSSMVALVSQPIRRTDKMRNGVKHVIGTLHEGELFVIVAVHGRCTSAPDVRGGDTDVQSASRAASSSLASMVLEIRCDDLAPVPTTSDSYHTPSSIPGFIRATDRQVQYAAAVLSPTPTCL